MDSNKEKKKVKASVITLIITFIVGIPILAGYVIFQDYSFLLRGGAVIMIGLVISNNQKEETQ